MGKKNIDLIEKDLRSLYAELKDINQHIMDIMIEKGGTDYRNGKIAGIGITKTKLNKIIEDYFEE